MSSHFPLLWQSPDGVSKLDNSSHVGEDKWNQVLKVDNATMVKSRNRRDRMLNHSGDSKIRTAVTVWMILP